MKHSYKISLTLSKSGQIILVSACEATSLISKKIEKLQFFVIIRTSYFLDNILSVSSHPIPLIYKFTTLSYQPLSDTLKLSLWASHRLTLSAKTHLTYDIALNWA